MTIIAYTDGSCASQSNSPGGWAAVFVDEATGATQTLSGFNLKTTNNRMEMLAVIKAMESLERGSHAIIFCDSKYVVDGFNKWLTKWKRNGKTRKNMDLWDQMLLASDGKKIVLKWVRAHNGNRWNELADRLAVKERNKAKQIKGQTVDNKTKKRVDKQIQHLYK